MRVLAVVLVLFAFSVLIVNPVGDFPLNDDFNYAFTAKTLAETGKIVFPYLPSPTMIFQSFFGAVFVLLFGSSYSVLRLSTIFMALVSVVSAYFILAELGFERKRILAALLVFVFNPLFFSIGFSFMTDVHFVALMLLSCLFYIKGFKQDSLVWLLLGSVFSVFSFLVRQNGVFIPAAALTYLVLRDRKFALIKFLVVFLLPLVLMSAYMYWYLFLSGPTEAFSGTLKETVSLVWLPYLPFRLFTVFEYVGLFLLPFSASALFGIRLDKKFFVVSGCFLLAGVLSYIVLLKFFGLGFPQLPNYIHAYGLGPSYLQGVKSPDVSWLMPILAFAGLASASVLAYLLSLNLRRFVVVSHASFVFILGFLFFGFLFILGSYFDRYLLTILFPAVVAVLYASSKIRLNYFVFSFFVALLAFYSIAGTHDYLSWNRAKQEAVSYLQSQGIAGINIDGGYEFDCSNFCEYSRRAGFNASKDYDPDWVRSSAYVIDSKYVVSFSPRPNYEVERQFGYFSLLTLKNERIYALKRA